jgi:glycosyltransferase involved in cell wall biosynthesis
MDNEKISVFIVCCNEEKNIRRCLQSVSWCDEILIVDSGSTDSTLAICKEFTDKITYNPWPGYSKQKAFALSKCSHEWVLNVDADEEVSPELKNSILLAINNPEPRIQGYFVLRVVYYLKRWWRSGGWYPEYRLRLVKKSTATWGGSNIHEHANVNGETKKLSGELFHYTYDSIASQVGVINKYSSLLVSETKEKAVKYLVLHMIVNSLARFIKFYFLKKGFKDGVAGFIVAITESYYVFLKYAKVWEEKNNQKKL